MNEIEVKLEIEAVNALILSVKFFITISASFLGLTLSFLGFADNPINEIRFHWLFVWGWIFLSYVLFSSIKGLIHAHELYMTRIGLLHTHEKEYDPDHLNKPLDDFIAHVKVLNFIMILGAAVLSLFVYENIQTSNSLIMLIENFLK